MNCFCEIEPKTYTKFKKSNGKVQKLEIKTCPKTGYTIDSALEKYEQSRDQPCEYYEETILAEVHEERDLNTIDDNIIIESSFDHLTPLITYFLADRRRETFNRLIDEIPLKRRETETEYIDRLKTFI